MKMVIVVDLPDVDPQDTMDLDPEEPAETLVALWAEEYRVGNMEYPIELVFAEWDGSAALTAQLHLNGIQ